jgi:hypothetical protein
MLMSAQHTCAYKKEEGIVIFKGAPVRCPALSESLTHIGHGECGGGVMGGVRGWKAEKPGLEYGGEGGSAAGWVKPGVNARISLGLPSEGWMGRGVGEVLCLVDNNG